MISLSPLHLGVLIGFCLVPLSETYFFVISFLSEGFEFVAFFPAARSEFLLPVGSAHWWVRLVQRLVLSPLDRQ